MTLRFCYVMYYTYNAFTSLPIGIDILPRTLLHDEVFYSETFLLNLMNSLH
jgi:hypothetical protein